MHAVPGKPSLPPYLFSHRIRAASTVSSALSEPAALPRPWMHLHRQRTEYNILLCLPGSFSECLFPGSEVAMSHRYAPPHEAVSHSAPPLKIPCSFPESHGCSDRYCRKYAALCVGRSYPAHASSVFLPVPAMHFHLAPAPFSAIPGFHLSPRRSPSDFGLPSHLQSMTSSPEPARFPLTQLRHFPLPEVLKTVPAYPAGCILPARSVLFPKMRLSTSRAAVSSLFPEAQNTPHAPDVTHRLPWHFPTLPVHGPFRSDIIPHGFLCILLPLSFLRPPHRQILSPAPDATVSEPSGSDSQAFVPVSPNGFETVLVPLHIPDSSGRFPFAFPTPSPLQERP